MPLSAEDAREAAWRAVAAVSPSEDTPTTKPRWAFMFGWEHPELHPRDFYGRPRWAFRDGRRAARAYARTQAKEAADAR